MGELNEYKCPCCGGTLAFDSGVQKMKCPFCDTEFEMETVLSYDQDLKMDGGGEINLDAKAPDTEWSESETAGLAVYVCQSCGGEVVGDENLGSTTCPYCGNNIVVKKQFSGALRPDLVIPFKLDKNTAIANYKKFLEGKPFLPKLFKSDNHVQEIKGLYVPFWLFDAKADADIRYKATKSMTRIAGSYNETTTKYYSITRSGSMTYGGVPVDGSTKMPDDMMESIEPYDLSQAVDFQTAYLAGYFADKYDVDSEACKPRAKERIKRSTENAFASTIGGDYTSVVPEASNIELSDVSIKYALLPVWTLVTNWNGKLYNFCMNGQTGTFVGDDLPPDMKKYWLNVIGYTVGIGAVIFGLLSLLGI